VTVKKKAKRIWAATCPKSGATFTRDGVGKRLEKGTKLCPYCASIRTETLLKWKLVPKSAVEE
jgi:hypothetical protein